MKNIEKVIKNLSKPTPSLLIFSFLFRSLVCTRVCAHSNKHPNGPPHGTPCAMAHLPKPVPTAHTVSPATSLSSPSHAPYAIVASPVAALPAPKLVLLERAKWIGFINSNTANFERKIWVGIITNFGPPTKHRILPNFICFHSITSDHMMPATGHLLCQEFERVSLELGGANQKEEEI